MDRLQHSESVYAIEALNFADLDVETWADPENSVRGVLTTFWGQSSKYFTEGRMDLPQEARGSDCFLRGVPTSIPIGNHRMKLYWKIVD